MPMDMRQIGRVVQAVKSHLTDDLRKPQYKGHENCMAGHCYVASEALYHLLGGKEAGWVPQTIQHEGGSHWFLRHKHSGTILDPTASQFKTPVPYEKGRGCGFLTKQPSKRAQVVLNRVAGDHDPVSKSEVSADWPNKVACSVAVFNSAGHLLMGQRNDSKRWTLPGGKMDEGERPEDCARRELKEEAGLEVKKLKFLGRGHGGLAGEWTIYSFEAHCDDAPNAENDPDKECEDWEWIPVSDGLPKEIENQLHNHDRDVTLQLLGLQSGSVEPTELSKGLKHKFFGAIAAAGLATSPMALAGEPDKKPDLSALHQELQPIAQLESSGGKNVNHKPHPLGEFHTAVGAVGMKPVTAHDEYMKSSWLQKVFPNLSDPVKFTHEFKTNDSLYNHAATSHWTRLKKMFNGDPNKAAYAWRWGQGAALRDAPEVQAGDPYVQAYQKLTAKARGALVAQHLINPLTKEEIDKWAKMDKPSKAKSLQAFDHYSMKPGLKELDPKHQGSGSVGPEKGRPKRLPRVYMYAADTKPEQHVAAASRAKYRIELPPHAKFYDMGSDELGLLEPKMRSTKYGQFYEPADFDEVERKIKRLGYAGYHNYMETAPNAYAIFSKVKARELPTMGA